MDEGDGPVTKYQIQVKKDTVPDDNWTNKSTILKNTETINFAAVNGLQYNTMYNIRVVAIYNDGIEEIPGRPSPTVNVKTNCKGR